MYSVFCRYTSLYTFCIYKKRKAPDRRIKFFRTFFSAKRKRLSIESVLSEFYCLDRHAVCFSCLLQFFRKFPDLRQFCFRFVLVARCRKDTGILDTRKSTQCFIGSDRAAKRIRRSCAEKQSCLRQLLAGSSGNPAGPRRHLAEIQQ